MIRNIAKIIYKELDKPENWKLDSGDYCLINKEYPNMKIWVANGFFFLGVWNYDHGKEYNFSIIEKFYLWPKVRKVLEQIKQTELTDKTLLEKQIESRILEK